MIRVKTMDPKTIDPWNTNFSELYKEPTCLVETEPQEVARMITERLENPYTAGENDMQRGKALLEREYGVSFDGTHMRDAAYIDWAIRSQVFHPLGIKVRAEDVSVVIEYVGRNAKLLLD